MKQRITLNLIAAASIAAVALLPACSKQSEPSGHSENDGHNHAKTNAPAQDDHAGHNHGPGGHPGESKTPSGK